MSKYIYIENFNKRKQNANDGNEINEWNKTKKKEGNSEQTSLKHRQNKEKSIELKRRR